MTGRALVLLPTSRSRASLRCQLLCWHFAWKVTLAKQLHRGRSENQSMCLASCSYQEVEVQPHGTFVLLLLAVTLSAGMPKSSASSLPVEISLMLSLLRREPSHHCPSQRA